MAIKEIKREWSPCQLDYVKTYLLHSEADVKDLPKCCVGSKATVSETDNEYVCTEDGWKLGSELGGGEVVILPETELSWANGPFALEIPLNGDLEIGKTYDVVFNGAAYDLAAFDNDGVVVVGAQTEGDGIPFQFHQAPPEVTAAEGIYGVCYVMDASLTSVTLSIVEAAKTESAGGGSGVLMINGKVGTFEESGDNMLAAPCTFDKTYAEVMAAVNAGQYVVLKTSVSNTAYVLPIVSFVEDLVSFAITVAGNTFGATIESTDGGSFFMQQPSA